MISIFLDITQHRFQIKKQSKSSLLANELDPYEKMFLIHPPSIYHGMLLMIGSIQIEM
jgi:hypothetical protein